MLSARSQIGTGKGLPAVLNESLATDMKPTTIRDLRDKSPFQPFALNLADGRAITVVTPD